MIIERVRVTLFQKFSRLSNATLFLTSFGLIAFGYIWIFMFSDGGTAFNIYRILFLPLLFASLAWLWSGRWTFDDSSHYAHHFKIAVWALFVVYVITLTYLKFQKLYSYNYDFFDAGIYYNRIWKISNLAPLQAVETALTEGHFQPVNLLFAFWGTSGFAPELAFFTETILLASGIFALRRLALRLTGNHFISFLIALSYISNPLLHFNDILGYHPDHIVLPCLLWGFAFLEDGKIRRAGVCFFLILASSEPWMPLGFALGLALCLEPVTRRLGILLSVSSASLFALVFFFLLPEFGSINAASNVITSTGPYSILVNPDADAFRLLISDPRKLFFIFFAFLPFLFSTFFGFRALLILGPDLAKILLSTEPLHYAVEGHYTLSIVAVGYWWFCKMIGKWRLVSRKAAGRTALVSAALSISLGVGHGCLPHSYNFWGTISGGAFHFTNYLKTQKYQDLLLVERNLVDDRTISVEISNGAFTPEIGRRFEFRHFPSNNPTPSSVVLIDRKFLYRAGYARNDDEFKARIENRLSDMQQCYRIIRMETMTAYVLRAECD